MSEQLVDMSISDLEEMNIRDVSAIKNSVLREIRQVKYLKTSLNRIIALSKGESFKSFHTAVRTLKGYEMMHMIRKGQIEGKGEFEKQIKFIDDLFALAA